MNLLEGVFLGVLNSIRLTVSLEQLSIVNEIGMLSCVRMTFVNNEEFDWSLVTELSCVEIVFLFFKYSSVLNCDVFNVSSFSSV